MQTQKQSFIEAVINTVRRWFNYKTKASALVYYPNGKLFWLHCFNCEIEMPVARKKNEDYCSNCGLIHKEF